MRDLYYVAVQSVRLWARKGSVWISIAVSLLLTIYLGLIGLEDRGYSPPIYGVLYIGLLSMALLLFYINSKETLDLVKALTISGGRQKHLAAVALSNTALASMPSIALALYIDPYILAVPAIVYPILYIAISRWRYILQESG